MDRSRVLHAFVLVPEQVQYSSTAHVVHLTWKQTSQQNAVAGHEHGSGSWRQGQGLVADLLSSRSATPALPGLVWKL